MGAGAGGGAGGGGTAAEGRPIAGLLVRAAGGTTGGIATEGRVGTWVTPRGAVVREGIAGGGGAWGRSGVIMSAGGSGTGTVLATPGGVMVCRAPTGTGGMPRSEARSPHGSTVAGAGGGGSGVGGVGSGGAWVGRAGAATSRAAAAVPGGGTWKMAAQTRQRARTPRSGTLAGSTRYTVLQLGQVTFMP
jgi:hypothetical protein